MQKRYLMSVVAILLVVGALGAGGYFLLREPSAVTPTPELPAASLETAQEQMDAGEFESAKVILEQIVAAEPENAEAYFLLGLTYFNLQMYDQAKDFFDRALTIEPDRAPAVHHNLGVLAYQLGDMETAVEEFQAAMELDPQDADTHYQLGAAYLVMAFPMDALEPDAAYLQQSQTEFEQALTLDSDKPEALVGLANVYMFQNKLPEAIELLETAVEQQPEMREALFALGRAYAVSGQLAKATETLNRFLETEPPEVWAQQAQELLAQLDQ